MTTEFVSKRPHKKSRGGCGTCKSKKIKCDEAHPKCAFCDKRNLTCTYSSRPNKSKSSPRLSRSPVDLSSSDSNDDAMEDIEISWDLIPSPAPPVLSTMGTLSSTDLRLMHHWSTATWNTLNVGNWADGVLRMVVPDLAFDHDFLLNSMLGIASLHQQHLVSDPLVNRKQTDMYRAKALSSFRLALTDIEFGTRKYEAALINSLLLVILCSKDYILDDGDLIVIHWLVLYRGLSAVINLRSYKAVSCLAVSPIFRREYSKLTCTPVIPRVLMNMVQEIHPKDPDFEILEDYCTALDALGTLYAGLKQDGVGPATSIRIITWPSFITQQFTTAAKDKRPRTLVILAYYLAFTRLVKGIWWVEGIAEREFPAVLRMLGPKWVPYLEIPIRAMMVGDIQEVADLFLK